jgi:hypothetical protein
VKRFLIELAMVLVAFGVGGVVLVALFPYQGDSNGDYSWFGNRVPFDSVFPSLIAGAVTVGVVWWVLRRVLRAASR